MSRIGSLLSAAGLVVFSLASVDADAGLIGRSVQPVFYADILEYDTPPVAAVPDQNQIDDDTQGVLRITDGSSFLFHDYFYEGFGDFLRVTFTDTQIILTNLVQGIFPPYTAADFRFVGSTRLVSVSIDPSSNPDFSTGATLLPRADGFRIDLSGTCETCFGLVDGHTGESIVLNVAVIPEPAPMALLGVGLAAMIWRRRKAPAGISRGGPIDGCRSHRSPGRPDRRALAFFRRQLPSSFDDDGRPAFQSCTCQQPVWSHSL